MRLSVFLYPIFIALGSLALLIMPVAADGIDVYILAGQSNMDGRGLVDELGESHPEYASANAEVSFWYANNYGDGYSTGWIDLAPGYSIPPGFNKGPQTLPSKTFGIEVVFGPMMAQLSGNGRVALIKVSRGGTNLRHDWSPDSTEGDELYPLLIDTVRNAMQELKTQGHTANLRGMVWHQGESDRKMGSYADRLDMFIGRVRKDLNEPSLPLLIGAVYDNGKRDTIRAQQRKAAEHIAHAAYVPCDGLTTFDETHFDTVSLIAFGQRMAVSMSELLQEQGQSPLPSRASNIK